MAERTSPLLVTTPVDSIELWTLNRPERRNPISDTDMVAAIIENIERIQTDASVKCVVLTGAGKAFSSGGDIKKMADRSGMFSGAPHEIRDGYRKGIQRIPVALREVDVPFIAAVNGPAVGAGMDLATMCDIRIAAESAWFAESFVTLGIIPGDGGAWFLPRLVGPARAAEMSFTGKRVDAVTAERWGLVNEVVADSALLDQALDMAQQIAANPGYAMRMTKQLLRESEAASLTSLLELSASLQAAAHHNPDHLEAVRAMLEKRKPQFSE